MRAEVMSAGDACSQIRRLEELLEMPIGCIAVWENATTIGFLFPAEVDAAYLRLVLGQLANAAQDAAKSL